MTASLPDFAVPGDSDTVRVTGQNKTADNQRQRGNARLIKVYSGPDKKYLLGEYDVPSGGTASLNAGQSKTFNIKFKFPDIGDANQIDPGTYTYYVELDAAWKSKVGSSAVTLPVRLPVRHCR